MAPGVVSRSQRRATASGRSPATARKAAPTVERAIGVTARRSSTWPGLLPRRPVVGHAATPENAGGPVGGGLVERALGPLQPVEQQVAAVDEVPELFASFVAVLVRDRLGGPAVAAAHLAAAVDGADGVIG